MAIDGINNSVQYVDDNYNPYNLSTEDFLKIYTTLLQNQDPTQPMDVNQMIQLNYELEQIQFMNQLEETLQTLINTQQLTFITQASNLIGKTVVFKENYITNPQAQYVLISDSNYSNVEIQIVNVDTGQVVKTINTDLQQGENDLDTSFLPAGTYAVNVYYNGQPLQNVQLGQKDTVLYVSLVNNRPVLGINFGEKSLNDILYISS
jgi:flagellar basal-body rod modification protein FlgD